MDVTGSQPAIPRCKRGALPAELHAHALTFLILKHFRRFANWKLWRKRFRHSPQIPPAESVTIIVPALRRPMTKTTNFYRRISEHCAAGVGFPPDGPLAGRYDLSFTVLSKCAEALRTSEADTAIIPAIEYQRMENVVLLPDMCVAAKGEVRSILVIGAQADRACQARRARHQFAKFRRAGRKPLCRNFWGISPEFVQAEPYLLQC